MEIILATGNVHKIREFRAIFRALPHFELISLYDNATYIPPEETGKTFKENAILKAMHAAEHFKKLVLADDSGLVVPALNGVPGVYSQRYAGPKATDVENRKKLLEEMRSLEDEQRAAYFECCLVLADQSGVKKISEGIVEGKILSEEKGAHGFGYDPIFLKEGYQKTFAQIDENVKNRISHRYKAFERLLPYLEMLKS